MGTLIIQTHETNRARTFGAQRMLEYITPTNSKPGPGPGKVVLLDVIPDLVEIDEQDQLPVRYFTLLQK